MKKPSKKKGLDSYLDSVGITSSLPGTKKKLGGYMSEVERLSKISAKELVYDTAKSVGLTKDYVDTVWAFLERHFGHEEDKIKDAVLSGAFQDKLASLGYNLEK